jgi:hypothetical protein
MKSDHCTDELITRMWPSAFESWNPDWPQPLRLPLHCVARIEGHCITMRLVHGHRFALLAMMLFACVSAMVSAEKVVQFSPTSSGYLKVDEDASMFHVFFDAREAEAPDSPIILWLQGGPGCSSMFGMLYINGPYFINEATLTLRKNDGSWNRLYGMLFIEQPMGTGFSNQVI